ncbi:MAG: hypothetical protein AAF639_06845 [Chloroflexota bacterium]
MSNLTNSNSTSAERRYEIYGQRFKNNPYPTYEQMRSESPVIHHPDK